MEREMMRIFDAEGNSIGVADRDEVHREGHWHETFHCWFISQEEDNSYIFFQVRSENKKDYPSLLDITAAGHILADESIEDGIREVQEELGVELSIDDLVPLGVIENSIVTEHIIDNEQSHVFLYKLPNKHIDYKLQKEEVSGIVSCDLNSFYHFCFGKFSELEIEGFVISDSGEKQPLHKSVGKSDFVPHQETYLEEVARLIKAHT